MRPLRSGVLIPLFIFGTGMACAQSFPDRAVRMVTSGAGGGADVATRLLAPGLAVHLGHPVGIDNQAAGITPIQMVAKAKPDGHVLLTYSSSLWIIPLMREMPYDAMRDFVPVAWLSKAPNILAVHPSLPVKSVRELLALARTRPGMLSYGTSGAGGAAHLTGELLKAAAGVDIVHVPYKGNAAALKDLLAGQVHMMFSNAGSIAPYLQSGKLRALAVTSAEPSALIPGLPTVAASGLPGYESTSIIGMFAPRGTAAAIVAQLNQDVARTLGQSDVSAGFLKAGLETVGGAPERLAAVMTGEITRLGKVIRDAGIRAD
jgi:tripartite-type tricarboxylate transporter receptor subunit TctC